MSAEAKEKVSLAQKARWETFHAKQKANVDMLAKLERSAKKAVKKVTKKVAKPVKAAVKKAAKEGYEENGQLRHPVLSGSGTHTTFFFGYSRSLSLSEQLFWSQREPPMKTTTIYLMMLAAVTVTSAVI